VSGLQSVVAETAQLPVADSPMHRKIPHAQPGLLERITKSRLAVKGRPFRHDGLEVADALLEGIVVATLLLLLDNWIPALKGEGRAIEFVNASVKHVDGSIILLGLLLLSLAVLFTDWRPTWLVRRLMVMPVLQFSRDVLLVGAGAIVAVVVATMFDTGWDARVSSVISPVSTLLLGGVEMQAGLWYCRASEDQRRKLLPVWAQNVVGLVSTIVFARMLLSFLKH
jgi:hypothetical protein